MSDATIKAHGEALGAALDNLKANGDDLAALRAQVAELREENEDEKSSHRATMKDFSELQQVYRAGLKQWNPVYKLVLDERDALRTQVAELREALNPFANLIRGGDSNYWLDGKWVLDARAALEMSGGVK